jgi:hypothetical protein
MSGFVACSCGYRGPGVEEGVGTVCPQCGSSAGESDGVVYHIPCPKGHVFRAREDWLGREMVCPKCNSPFLIQATSSLEYRREQKRRQDAIDERAAKAWLTRAIVAGVVVLLSFVAMIIASQNPQWFRPKG